MPVPIPKISHEFRDAVHNFIRVDSDERRVIDSSPVQRLRAIHQLALTYLVYSGATHKRFEHSLGVMNLAGRVFDVLVRQEHLTDEVRRLVPEVMEIDKLSHWRQVVRLAALCHDLGHVPFSHASEGLLPKGFTHEHMSQLLILETLPDLLNSLFPQVDPNLVAKIAVGPKVTGETYSNWEALLYEIIGSDAFGVDRMDYLLRDSHHLGVAYGVFDHWRLIDTLRILPSPPTGDDDADSEPALGVEYGGLQAAEALLSARYQMFSQVYFHPVRLAYDVHLREFLSAWLPSGQYDVTVTSHQQMNDNVVLSQLEEAARSGHGDVQDKASRILDRRHFKALYEYTPSDTTVYEVDPVDAVFRAAKERFGKENVRSVQSRKEGGEVDFPVLMRDGEIASSTSLSQVLRSLPPAGRDLVIVSPDQVEAARIWLGRNKSAILRGGSK